jgi:hypothetical protein
LDSTAAAAAAAAGAAAAMAGSGYPGVSHYTRTSRRYTPVCWCLVQGSLYIPCLRR